MVAKVRRYCGTPFKDRRGVTQGGTISPTLFNMVVGAAIFHWVVMVAGEEVLPYGFGREVQWLSMFFYTNYGLLGKDPLLLSLYYYLELFETLKIKIMLSICHNKTHVQ